jgi:hypothetical protein
VVVIDVCLLLVVVLFKITSVVYKCIILKFLYQIESKTEELTLVDPQLPPSVAW